MPRPTHRRFHTLTLALLALSTPALAATLTTSGTTGNLTTVTYAPAQTPANGDALVLEGAFNITYNAADSTIVNSLASLSLNVGGGAGTFTQDAGPGTTLTIGTLNLAAPGGASRVPTYNVNSGTLAVTNAISFGNGTNGNGIRLIVNENAALTYSGTSLSLATGGGARSSLILNGGSFTTTTVPNIYLGNVNLNNGANAFLTIADSTNGVPSAFNAPNSTLVAGQFNNNGGSNQTNGTITLSGNSSLTVANLVLGGANAVNRVNGIVNMSGGTLTTSNILLGNSSLTPSATTNAFNMSGGTIRFSSSGTLFSKADLTGSLYVNLTGAGLTLDTQSFNVTSAAPIHGSAGLTKAGAGTLTLSGNSDYTGPTNITAGALNGSGTLASALTLSSNTTMSIGAQNTIASLTNTASTTLADNTSFLFDFNLGTDASPTASIDLLTTNGLTLGSNINATLTFLGNGAGLQLGQVFTLISNTSANPISGAFANLPESAIIDISSFPGSPQLTLSYTGNDGNDLTLTVTAIPEPAIAALVIPVAALLRRRR